MLAVLKFFLGQDAVDEAGSDDEEGKKKDWDEEAKAKMPSKQDIYRAYNKVCVWGRGQGQDAQQAGYLPCLQQGVCV